MDEQRIAAMYLNLFTGWLNRIWHGIFSRGLRRSPALPWIVIFILVGLPSLGWYLHRRGQFATLKRDLKGQQQTSSVPVPSPGGMEPIVLKRSLTPGAATPELTSVTVLPGLGMDVLQLTANLPGRGDTALFADPTVEEMADNSAPPRNGLYDTHGAIEAPWGGLLFGLVSPIGTSMTFNWADHQVQVPTDVVARGIDASGLLARTAVDSQQTTTLDDGAVATGVVRASNFDEHWPGRLDLQVSVELGPSDLNIILTARNTGATPVPFGAGWHPRFQVLSGSAQAIQIRLPEGQQLGLADSAKDLPSGRIEAPSAEVARLQSRAASPGATSLEATLVHLRPGMLDTLPAAEFRDPLAGYGLRLTSQSPATRALRVVAPAQGGYVSLGMQTNFDDPFGREWDGAEGSGMVTLLPGQTFQWKIRLEVFPVRHSESPINN